jgi:hypothetical protein
MSWEGLAGNRDRLVGKDKRKTASQKILNYMPCLDSNSQAPVRNQPQAKPFRRPPREEPTESDKIIQPRLGRIRKKKIKIKSQSKSLSMLSLPSIEGKGQSKKYQEGEGNAHCHGNPPNGEEKQKEWYQPPKPAPIRIPRSYVYLRARIDIWNERKRHYSGLFMSVSLAPRRARS